MPLARLVVVLGLLVLAACKVELYTGLSEREANEMWAILLDADIPSEKVTGGDGTYALNVEETLIAHAIEILKENGYPREQFSSIGDVFKKEGLISSPMEERVRFVYALSQELSGTISQIDGVLAARVHVVLPNNEFADENVKPSSAAVFIKYQSDYNLEQLKPQIKLLVTRSIEGLNYDNVEVVLFPVTPRHTASADAGLEEIISVRVAPSSVDNFWMIVGGLGLLALLALGGNCVLFYLLKRSNGRAQTQDAG